MSKENYAPWDSAEFLNDDEAIMEYLRAALEENDLGFFMKAFDNAVRARNMNHASQNAEWLMKNLSTLSTSTGLRENQQLNSEKETIMTVESDVSSTSVNWRETEEAKHPSIEADVASPYMEVNV